jgi:anti-sigma factor RsiW
MNCAQVRGLFGAYWDDETTQGEREALEHHFAACTECRAEYEAFSRTLELVGSLPRAEAAPDLVERVLAGTRRASPEPDRVVSRRPGWVPLTAAAVAVLIAVATLAPWLRVSPRRNGNTATPIARVETVREAVRVQHLATGGTPSGTNAASRTAPATTLASVSDSVFDHSDDVEFILDPVSVKRGRVRAYTPYTSGVEGQRASISF